MKMRIVMYFLFLVFLTAFTSCEEGRPKPPPKSNPKANPEERRRTTENIEEKNGLHSFEKYQNAFAEIAPHDKAKFTTKILDELDVFSVNYQEYENEFSQVTRTENDSLVIDYAWNESGIYFVKDENNGFNIDISTEEYPVLFVSDHELYHFQASIANIESDELYLSFTRLDHGKLVSAQASLKKGPNGLILKFNDKEFMRKSDSKKLRIIERNLDQ